MPAALLQLHIATAANRLQYAGTITYTWDANGNLKTKVTPAGTISYTYDYANRLTETITSTNTYQYAYDGDGMRVRKVVNGSPTNFVWDKALGLPVVLTDSNSIYLHGLGLIAQQTGGDVAYYHSDGLGSVRNLTNASGQAIVGYGYDAFGGLRSSSGTLGNDFRFTGEQFDAETGLYYLRARYYDPGAGRFISRDPFPGFPEQPASLNAYSYGYNNPVRLTDPTGLFVLFVGGMFTGNDEIENLGAWSTMIRELQLDPTHSTGEEWAFFNWGDEPGVSTLLQLEIAAGRLRQQIACEEDIKIIGHSRGGALVMEYLAEIAEGRLPLNGQLRGVYSIDGALWPGNAFLRNPWAGKRFVGSIGPFLRKDRYADLPARLEERGTTIDAATFDNKADFIFTTHDPLPGMDAYQWTI